MVAGDTFGGRDSGRGYAVKTLKNLTVERLKEVLRYDSETGIFTWQVPTSNRVRTGAQGRGLNGSGYLRIGIDGERYRAHRLAWLYVHGRWPIEHLDHIDRNPANNAIANLRECTHAENHRNRGAQANNKSGHKNVDWCAAVNKWRVVLAHDGKQHVVGYYGHIELAIIAAAQARVLLHGSFARHS